MIGVAYLQGLALGFGLIVAIGAQNAFVLRQGIRGEHVLAVVILCSTADAALVTAGVYGMAKAIGTIPWLGWMLGLAGALFLFAYGWTALRRAQSPGSMQAVPSGEEDVVCGVERGVSPSAQEVSTGKPLRRGAILLQAAGFTFLNPHVYLDTVMLVGSVGSQQPAQLQAWFVAGAATASVIWFAALGFGARLMAPWFAKPRAWRLLDRIIGTTMWVLGATMLYQSFASLRGVQGAT